MTVSPATRGPVSMGKKRIVQAIIRAALITCGVLLIPLWGVFYVDGWNWDWHGFVAAGVFVFTAALTYEGLAGRVGDRAYRFGVGLAVVTAFASTWVNIVLAADENPANLMYLGVVAVGVIGTALSRLHARGMARVWFGTALAQILMPLIAPVFGKAHLARGNAVPVIGLNGLFAVLFVAAALLFRSAARKHR